MIKQKTFRKGPIGSLTDEYEKALAEYKEVLQAVTPAQYKEIVLPGDQHIKSIRNIAEHVVNSGYGYANYFRNYFHAKTIPAPTPKCPTVQSAIKDTDAMWKYTLDTLVFKQNMSDLEMDDTLIRTSWTIYNAEALWEHAVMHIHRHRRQIQRFFSLIE